MPELILLARPEKVVYIISPVEESSSVRIMSNLRTIGRSLLR